MCRVIKAASVTSPIRQALGAHLGKVLTPELAALIEQAAFFVPDDSRELAALSRTPTKDQITRIENLILQCDQVDTPIKNYFSTGMYAREMFIPAGTVLTGAIHKVEHLSIFVGDITVWTEGGMKRMTGHNTFISKPGAKRVGYAHADTWCTGFFPTDKTDVTELENDLVEDAHRLQSRLQSLTTQPMAKLEN